MPQIADYKLPVIDTQTQKRNFPGSDKKQYYTMADMQAEGQAGTTDTDSFTGEGGAEWEPRGDGYAAIYKKHGPFGRPYQTNSPHTKEN
jgi:hypothetical protein